MWPPFGSELATGNRGWKECHVERIVVYFATNKLLLSLFIAARLIVLTSLLVAVLRLRRNSRVFETFFRKIAIAQLHIFNIAAEYTLELGFQEN